MRLHRLLSTVIEGQRRYFSEGRAEIARENLITMQITGAIGALVSGVFFIIAPIIIPSWHITIEYVFVVPILFLTFLFSFIYSRRKAEPKPLVVEIASAAFYVLLLADFIALSTFPYPNTPQIFISLCFMFMPALIIQRPTVLLGIMISAEVVFICLAVRFKTDFSVENDIFNTIAALFFSLISMITSNRLRCRNHITRVTLQKLSQTDALTGLLNKTAFEQCVTAYLCRPESFGGCALLVLDIDCFKTMNDRYGHQFGDALLKSVGAILQGSFRQTDLVGRIGGDEFGVLMRGACDNSLIEAKCESLRVRFAEVTVDGKNAHMTCSIGVAVSRSESATYSELFHIADEALYGVKRSGKDSSAITLHS